MELVDGRAGLVVVMGGLVKGGLELSVVKLWMVGELVELMGAVSAMLF